MPGDDLLPKGNHTDYAPDSAEHRAAMGGKKKNKVLDALASRKGGSGNGGLVGLAAKIYTGGKA
jgi:hypothetical protein